MGAHSLDPELVFVGGTNRVVRSDLEIIIVFILIQQTLERELELLSALHLFGSA